MMNMRQPCHSLFYSLSALFSFCDSDSIRTSIYSHLSVPFSNTCRWYVMELYHTFWFWLGLGLGLGLGLRWYDMRSLVYVYSIDRVCNCREIYLIDKYNYIYTMRNLIFKMNGNIVLIVELKTSFNLVWDTQSLIEIERGDTILVRYYILWFVIDFFYN